MPAQALQLVKTPAIEGVFLFGLAGEWKPLGRLPPKIMEPHFRIFADNPHSLHQLRQMSVSFCKSSLQSARSTMSSAYASALRINPSMLVPKPES